MKLIKASLAVLFTLGLLSLASAQDEGIGVSNNQIVGLIRFD